MADTSTHARALAIALLAAPAHAADLPQCEPPNVARVVEGFTPTTTTNDIVNMPLQFALACPDVGPCGWVLTNPEPKPSPNVVCLTPEQNAEAEERGR